MRYRKRFGRWGEGAVARAFRDRNYQILTAPGMNRYAGRDLVVCKAGREIDLQVKSTARMQRDGSPMIEYQMHWIAAADLVSFSKELNRELWLAIVDPRRRLIFLYSVNNPHSGKGYVRRLVEEMWNGKGDHVSSPGAIYLPYEDARPIWDLTTPECVEGLSIAEDESDNGADLLE